MVEETERKERKKKRKTVMPFEKHEWMQLPLLLPLLLLLREQWMGGWWVGVAWDEETGTARHGDAMCAARCGVVWCGVA